MLFRSEIDDIQSQSSQEIPDKQSLNLQEIDDIQSETSQEDVIFQENLKTIVNCCSGEIIDDIKDSQDDHNLSQFRYTKITKERKNNNNQIIKYNLRKYNVPKGWKHEIKNRKTGKSKGRQYNIWISPDNKKFYSYKKVQMYLRYSN